MVNGNPYFKKLNKFIMAKVGMFELSLPHLC